MQHCSIFTTAVIIEKLLPLKNEFHEKAVVPWMPSSRGVAAEDRDSDCRDKPNRAGYLPRRVYCSISPGRLGRTSRHPHGQSKNRRFSSRALFHLDSLVHRNARFIKLAAALGSLELTIPEDLRGSVSWRQKKLGRRRQGGGVTSWSVGKEKESPGLWAWHLSWALNSLEKTF